MKSSRKEQDMKRGVAGKTTTEKKKMKQEGSSWERVRLAAVLPLTPWSSKCPARQHVAKGRQGLKHLISDTTGGGGAVQKASYVCDRIIGATLQIICAVWATVWREQRRQLQQEAVRSCGWEDPGRKRVRTPHSQIKSAVTDYHQSSEVGGEGISSEVGEVITGRVAPTSLGSREMKSRWNCGSITCIICLTCVGSQLSISSSSASSFSGPVQLCCRSGESERRRWERVSRELKVVLKMQRD